jgi:hypothetical protein
MLRDKQSMADIEQLFYEARIQLANAGSVRDGVQREIAAATIRQRPAIGWPLVICVALLIASLCVARWVRRPRNVQLATVAAALPQDLRVEVGDADIVQHLAASTNRGAVLVIWSYRGPGLAAMGPGSPQAPASKYRFRILQKTNIAGGRTLVCSLFLPDPSVHPELEPPAVCAIRADDQLIACSASPRTMSAAQLRSTLDRLGLEHVFRDLNESNQ